MPKIIHRDGKCYEQVAPTSFYEADIEQALMLHAMQLYPDHCMIPFKVPIKSSDGSTVKADLALISKNYSDWWIIEVEMPNHPLDGHVSPQIEQLYNGVYEAKEATYIHNQLQSLNGTLPTEQQFPLDMNKLLHLVKNVPPRISVVLNGRFNFEWLVELNRFGAQLSSFEVFRSPEFEELYSLSGYYMGKFVDKVITHCHFERIFGLLRVDDPSQLSINPRERFTIHYEGYISEWERIDAQGKVWLGPVKRPPIPLKENALYELVKHFDNTFGIVITETL